MAKHLGQGINQLPQNVPALEDIVRTNPVAQQAQSPLARKLLKNRKLARAKRKAEGGSVIADAFFGAGGGNLGGILGVGRLPKRSSVTNRSIFEERKRPSLSFR